MNIVYIIAMFIVMIFYVDYYVLLRELMDMTVIILIVLVNVHNHNIEFKALFKQVESWLLELAERQVRYDLW